MYNSINLQPTLVYIYFANMKLTPPFEENIEQQYHCTDLLFFFFTAGYIFYGWHKNIPFIITVLVHRRYIMHEGKNGIPPETLF